MPDLSSNLTSLEADGHVVEVFASIFDRGSSVMEGTIQAPLSTATTLVSYSVNVTSGALANVQDHYLADFYDSGGSNYKGTLRIRTGAFGGSLLFVEEHVTAMVNVVVGDVVKVYQDFRILRYLPYVQSGAPFDPDAVGYTNENSVVKPIANAGGPRATWVDDGQSYATMNFDASNSFNIDPDSGSTQTYSWTFPAGSTPTSSTAQAPTGVQIPSGQHEIKLVVTDSSNSATETKWLPVYVHDSNDPPVKLRSLRLSGKREDGWSAEFTPEDTLNTTDAPDRALVVIWYREIINGTEQSFGNINSEVNHVKFVGWLNKDSSDSSPGEQETKFSAISSLEVLKATTGFSKVLIDTASPAEWAEFKDLSVQQAIVNILRVYSSACLINDLIFDISDISYPRLFSEKKNPYQQVKELADAIDAIFTADCTSKMLCYTKQEYTSNTNRAGLTQIFDLDAGNLQDLNVERFHDRPVERVKVYGFDPDGDTGYISFWPGLAQGWGTVNAEVTRLISSSQSDMNIRAGYRGGEQERIYTNDNGIKSKIPYVTFTLDGGFHVIDFYREFIGLNISGTYNNRNIDLSSYNFVIDTINVSYDKFTYDVKVRAHAATHGLPGQTPPSLSLISGTLNDDDVDYNAYTPYIIPDPQPSFVYWDDNVDWIAALDAAGSQWWFTKDFTTESGSGGPTWTSASITGISGTIMMFIQDASVSGTSDSRSGWLVTTTNIYYHTINLNTQTVTSSTNQHTFTNAISWVGGDADYLFNPGQNVTLSYIDPTAVNWKIAYTSNGGSTWSTRSPGSGGDNSSVGVAYSTTVENRVYMLLDDSGIDEQIYRSSDRGATNGTKLNVGQWEGNGCHIALPFGRDDYMIITFEQATGQHRPHRFLTDGSGSSTALGFSGTTVTSAYPRNQFNIPRDNNDRYFVARGGYIEYQDGLITGSLGARTTVASSVGAEFVFPIDNSNGTTGYYCGSSGSIGYFEVGVGADDRSGSTSPISTANSLITIIGGKQ